MASLIGKKYILLDLIGSGSFGSIYQGENVRTNEKVAIKVEPIKNETKLLKNEATIYQYFFTDIYESCKNLHFIDKNMTDHVQNYRFKFFENLIKVNDIILYEPEEINNQEEQEFKETKKAIDLDKSLKKVGMNETNIVEGKRNRKKNSQFEDYLLE